MLASVSVRLPATRGGLHLNSNVAARHEQMLLARPSVIVSHEICNHLVMKSLGGDGDDGSKRLRDRHACSLSSLSVLSACIQLEGD